jgi:hypothetical protein
MFIVHPRPTVGAGSPIETAPTIVPPLKTSNAIFNVPVRQWYHLLYKTKKYEKSSSGADSI